MLSVQIPVTLSKPYLDDVTLMVSVRVDAVLRDDQVSGLKVMVQHTNVELVGENETISFSLQELQKAVEALS